MSITSATICAAADQLQGLVGYNAKTSQYIVRFSEDSFGKDVPDDRIVPACEFVWKPLLGNLMTPWFNAWGHQTPLGYKKPKKAKKGGAE